MTLRAILILLPLTTYAACKLGPFPDEPAEVPTAPEPDWGGVGQHDGGAEASTPPPATRAH